MLTVINTQTIIVTKGITVMWAWPGDIESEAECHTWPGLVTGDTHGAGSGSGSRYLTFPTRASSQWVRGLGGGPGLSPHITLNTQIADRNQTGNIGGISGKLEFSNWIFRQILCIRDRTSRKIIEIEFIHNHRDHFKNFADSKFPPVCILASRKEGGSYCICPHQSSVVMAASPIPRMRRRSEQEVEADELTEKELDVITTVFRSYETGLREATILPKVVSFINVVFRIIIGNLSTEVKEKF